MQIVRQLAYSNVDNRSASPSLIQSVLDLSSWGTGFSSLVTIPRNDDLEATGHEYPLGEAAQRVGRVRMNKLVLQPPISKPRLGPLLVVCITACNESYEELQVRLLFRLPAAV